MSPTKKHDQFHCSIWASKVICFWKIRKLFQSDRNFLPSYVDPAISMPCCCLAWYLPYVFQMFSRFGGKNICTTDTWVETQGSWVQAALTPNWNSQVFGWIIMCHLVSTFVIGPRTPLVDYTIQYTRTENSVVNCQLAVPATSLPLCLFDTWVSRHVAHGSKAESAWVGGSTTESSSKSCQSVAEPARCTYDVPGWSQNSL